MASPLDFYDYINHDIANRFKSKEMPNKNTHDILCSNRAHNIGYDVIN